MSGTLSLRLQLRLTKLHELNCKVILTWEWVDKKYQGTKINLASQTHAITNYTLIQNKGDL